MNTRREFLHTIAATSVGLSLFDHWSLLPGVKTGDNTGQQQLRVALMGLGGYATRVAEAMQSCKLARISGLISGTPSKIESWQKKYNIAEKNCNNYDK